MPPIRFEKILIADERFEAAGVADVDGDGIPDIVSGAFWYPGPDFREKRRIYDPVTRAEGEYYDDFSAILIDITGDGLPDLVTGGWFGKRLRWHENPGPDVEGDWPVHELEEIGNIETTRAWDIDGDGRIEIVPNTPNHPQIVYKPDGAGGLVGYELFPEPLGHGLGCGDVDGDGRPELVTAHGYLEAGDDPLAPWTFRERFDLGAASIPIVVADVDGDGRADLVVGQSHGYGLDWWKQRSDDDWVKHPIDPTCGQYHDLWWGDIDGDGRPELVAGKRYRAHCGRDPGADDDVGTYYFTWTGEGFAKQVIDFGPARIGTGIGIHCAVADLSGDGRPDVVAPGKDGLYLFRNLGPSHRRGR